MSKPHVHDGTYHDQRDKDDMISNAEVVVEEKKVLEISIKQNLILLM